MRFIVDNKIQIESPTEELIDWCENNLVLDNPEYYKKQRMGLWTGNVLKQFKLYESIGNNILLPYGCISELYKKYARQYMFYSNIKPPICVKYNSGINLYPYQEKAVTEAIRASHGVIVMPCGAGKTQTALEIVARLGMRCLWLTHTQDLMYQSLDRARTVLGIEKESYGKITGGKVNIGRGITFATVQTMAKLDLPLYKNMFDIVIVDECHKAIGSPTRVMQFYKVLSNLSCKYKFGITATPRRADGLEKAMFALIGGVICEVSKESVRETTCPVDVKIYETGYKPDLHVVLSGDGTLNYAALVDDMIENQDRFDFVSDVIVGHKKRGAMLVLANRVDYLKRLNEKYPGRSICLSGLRNTKVGKAERKEALKKLNNGDIDCIFATYQLAKEGLDVPNLRTLIMATPEKDETTVTQAAGRVGRKAEEKDGGLIIDLSDDFGMYNGWKKKRVKYYSKLGYNVLTEM